MIGVQIFAFLMFINSGASNVTGYYTASTENHRFILNLTKSSYCLEFLSIDDDLIIDLLSFGSYKLEGNNIVFKDSLNSFLLHATLNNYGITFNKGYKFLEGVEMKFASKKYSEKNLDILTRRVKWASKYTTLNIIQIDVMNKFFCVNSKFYLEFEKDRYTLVINDLAVSTGKYKRGISLITLFDEALVNEFTLIVEYDHLVPVTLPVLVGDVHFELQGCSQ